MPSAKTMWRLLMPCMREHRKTKAANLPSDYTQASTRYRFRGRTRFMAERSCRVLHLQIGSLGDYLSIGLTSM